MNMVSGKISNAHQLGAMFAMGKVMSDHAYQQTLRIINLPMIRPLVRDIIDGIVEGNNEIN